MHILVTGLHVISEMECEVELTVEVIDYGDHTNAVEVAVNLGRKYGFELEQREAITKWLSSPKTQTGSVLLTTDPRLPSSSKEDRYQLVVFYNDVPQICRMKTERVQVTETRVDVQILPSNVKKVTPISKKNRK